MGNPTCIGPGESPVPHAVHGSEFLENAAHRTIRKELWRRIHRVLNITGLPEELSSVLWNVRITTGLPTFLGDRFIPNLQEPVETQFRRELIAVLRRAETELPAEPSDDEIVIASANRMGRPVDCKNP